MELLVEGCRHLREGDDGSHLRFVTHWYPYTRRYSPKLLEVTPFRFISDPALGNRDQRRKLTTEAPTGFLPRRWAKYVTARDKGEPPTVARPYYELALLTTLNERLKSGDVTVTHSRRWTDFEDYLIPRATWPKSASNTTPIWVCLCRASNTSFSSGHSWRPSLLKWTAEYPETRPFPSMRKKASSISPRRKGPTSPTGQNAQGAHRITAAAHVTGGRPHRHGPPHRLPAPLPSLRRGRIALARR
jgi:hypothetical protein